MKRRVFLRSVTATAIAACGGCGDGLHHGTPASGPVDGGNVKNVAIGSLAAIGGVPVILGRDAAGLYAMSAICTHDACDMTRDGSITASGVRCDCHGSRFDTNGAVRVGPASSPLDHYRVDLAADGTITVQAGQIVPKTTRTAAA